MYIIIITLLAAVVVILILVKIVPFNLLLENVELDYGKINSWDYITAIKRICNVLCDYLTLYWQWYFILKAAFNSNISSQDYYLLFMFLNMFLVCGFILKKTFFSTYRTMPFTIDIEDMKRYMCLDSVNVTESTCDEFIVGIFESLNLKKTEYYLVVREISVLKSIHSSDYNPLDNFTKKTFEVESMSFNLEDIRMQFDSIKSGHISVPVDGINRDLFK